MKIKYAIFAFFLYTVGGNFNFQGFLDSATASGIVLVASDPNATVNGYADLTGTKLEVTLYEVAQASGTVKKPQVKIVVLPPGQGAAIDAAVAANDP